MAIRLEPQWGEKKVFRSKRGVDSSWINASTDHERVSCADSGNSRVSSDDWDLWLERHPGCVIASWYGINDQYWSLRSFQNGKIERFKVTPRHQGVPWSYQIPETPIEAMPAWVFEAMIELGEITTPELEEAKAVQTIADGHAWMVPGGMAFDICVRPVIERWSKEVPR